MNAFLAFFKQFHSEIFSSNHEKINGQNQSCNLLLKLNIFGSISTANFRTLFVLNLFIDNFKDFWRFLNASISMLSFFAKLYVSELEAVFLACFQIELLLKQD